MARKKKKKWYEKQIDRRITRYEAMSDDEFSSVYEKELVKGVANAGLGVLLVIACIVAMFIFL